MKAFSVLPHYRQDPIWVLGMHRSGTTLVSQILSHLKVFQGTSMEGHHEPVFFRDANEWLLGTIHAGWDRPQPIRELYSDSRLCADIVTRLDSRVQSLDFIKTFLGVKTIKRFYGRKEFLWGWKEPRMTLTFPLWYRLFSKARIIFIYRNGIDTANSLVERERWRLDQHEHSASVFDDPFFSLRCQDFERAFSLWEAYNQLFYENLERMSSVIPLLILRYESLVKNPAYELKRISDFIGYKAAIPVNESFIGEIKRHSPYRFFQNQYLLNQYRLKRKNSMMITLGYNRIEKNEQRKAEHISISSL